MQSSSPRAASRLGIVIPARNEGSRIAAVLQRLPARLDAVDELATIVVDDGSTDQTATVAAAAGARVLRHRANLGKGAALTTGCEAAIGAGCTVIALMDADGQHEPDDLPRLVEPIIAGRADLTLGRRRFGRGMPAAARLGNWGLSTAFQLFFHCRIGDTQSGYRAFRAAVYPSLRWLSVDYSVETEMLIHMARAQLRFEEIDIGTIYHDRYKGTTISDGFRIFSNMLRWTMQR
jgi:glycosyltransferase involved in cell wall biosynthesis